MTANVNQPVCMNTRFRVRQARLRPAFTLAELLITVAILALLASLLLGAVSRATESARAAACANNLQQIGLASVTYSLDANNRLPSFRNWLFTRPGDLTTGKLFPYLQSKPVYLCPTDQRLLASRRPRAPQAAPRPAFGNSGRRRDYSFAMNCAICHANDLSQFLEPARTVIYMEGELGPNDYTGLVGPGLVSQSLAFRHRGRGHLIFGDLRLERMDRREFARVSRMNRFWFPTDDLSGPGGMRFDFGRR